LRARPEARQQQQSLQVPIIDPHCGCFYICFTLFVSRSCTRFFSAGRRPSCLPACPVRPPDSSSLPVVCCLATEINLKKPRALTDVRRGGDAQYLSTPQFFPPPPSSQPAFPTPPSSQPAAPFIDRERSLSARPPTRRAEHLAAAAARLACRSRQEAAARPAIYIYLLYLSLCGAYDRTELRCHL
jgi:hypothetical protein